MLKGLSAIQMLSRETSKDLELDRWLPDGKSVTVTGTKKSYSDSY